MATVKLPAGAPAAQALSARALQGILSHDQYDDWLPDCVYWLDYAQSPQALLQRVSKAFVAGQIEAEDPVLLQLPRKQGKPLPAARLALAERVCAHALLGANANALERMIIRDKVYGFRYRETATPLFSPPGEGIADVFRAAVFATTISDCSNLQVWDVDAFSTKAEFTRLDQVFLAAGVPGVARALKVLLGGPATGLPSCDDAFAFAYNCYLQPVDQKLLAQRVNYFRYRDEYFLLRDTDRPKLAAAQASIGVTSRLRAEFGNCSAMREADRWQSDENVFVHDDGAVVAELIRCRDESGEPVSDCWELEGFAHTDGGVNLSRHLETAGARRLVDAIRFVPTWRALNLARRTGVQLLPPFAVAANEYRKLTTDVDKLDRGMRTALAVAMQQGDSWQTMWCATLMSDRSVLTSEDRQLLADAANATRLIPAAQWTALIALARHGAGVDAAIWQKPGASQSSDTHRRALLAASYLARHGKPKHWSALRSRFAPRYPELVRLLDSWHGA
jgi:hypothetical protein